LERPRAEEGDPDAFEEEEVAAGIGMITGAGLGEGETSGGEGAGDILSTSTHVVKRESELNSITST
jgi:hypothetical protein